MNKPIELKECPFCGGSNIRLHKAGNTDLMNYFCANPTCMLQGKARYKETEAREYWNTRSNTQLQAKAELVDGFVSAVNELSFILRLIATDPDNYNDKQIKAANLLLTKAKMEGLE